MATNPPRPETWSFVEKNGVFSQCRTSLSRSSMRGSAREGILDLMRNDPSGIRPASSRRKQSFKRSKNHEQREMPVYLGSQSRDYVFCTAAASDISSMRVLNFGESSPYFEMHAHGERLHRSEVIKNSNLVTWNRFRLNREQLEDVDNVVVTLWHKTTGLGDDRLMRS